MANNDLLKWVTSDVDFYELLGITFEQCSESELRRAYRKTALKYHPDKVGKDFDPDKYELFQAANEVLGDPEMKAKYDNHRQAKIQKQRANELFEGKRRQMKEDLEARERGGLPTGMKRSREDDAQSQEFRKLAEAGRKRKAARASMMPGDIRVDVASSSAPPSPKKETPRKEAPETSTAAEEQQEEDAVERLERKIRENQQAKAARKAEKKARKSGIFVPADSPSVDSASGPKLADQDTATPIKRPDLFKGLKADEKSSASPKFSFSPNTPKKNDFAATMARLKAAEKERLEAEIRQQEAEAAN
jgi:DnaJ family protein C protein 17